MNTLAARAVAVIALAVCPAVFAALPTQTPVSVVKKTPGTTFKAGKAKATLYTWKITDTRSPYLGVTLVWLEIKESDSILSIENTGGASVTQSIPADALAVLSGGTWTGRYDSPTSQKRGSGLVIASGAVLTGFAPDNTGGVLVACDDDVDVLDTASYSRKFGNRNPCQAQGKTKGANSALQTSAIVLRDGMADRSLPRTEKANRLAAGQDKDQIIIAGAFNSLGTALSLAEFGAYFAAAGQVLGRTKVTALNLDGGCSAQLVIPALKRQFGCEKAGFNINRIVVRPEK